MNKFLATGLLAAAASAEKEYTRFADLMAQYGYTWEALKVTTEDGYILTTFHVTGNADGPLEPSMPPVLIQHGDSSDGAGWLGGYDSGVPMHLQLADAGYDVYIGNNRGTEYCQEHVSLSVDDADFWKWTWAQMGLYDDTANIAAIKAHSGADKIFYLGWSQGTVQMFYALAHLEEEVLADSLHKFVALAPCTICKKDGDLAYYEDSLFAYPSIGVYDLYGPNWDAEYAQICKELGDDACDYGSCDWCQPMSVLSEEHWWQNAFTDRFQEFAPNWEQGEKEAALIDLASIDKVPIAMFSGTNDQICPYLTAKKTQSIIGDAVVHFQTIINQGHMYFGSANDEWFMGKLIE